MRNFLAAIVLTLPLAACSGAADGAVATATGEEPSVVAMSVDEIAALRDAGAIADGELTLVDVRTVEEHRGGNIGGSLLMPLDAFDPVDLAGTDPDTVVFYCRSGRRSAIAAGQFARYTGRPARHMDGGILAWDAAGKDIFHPYVIE